MLSNGHSLINYENGNFKHFFNILSFYSLLLLKKNTFISCFFHEIVLVACSLKTCLLQNHFFCIVNNYKSTKRTMYSRPPMSRTLISQSAEFGHIFYFVFISTPFIFITLLLTSQNNLLRLENLHLKCQGPVVQSTVSLTS